MTSPLTLAQAANRWVQANGCAIHDVAMSPKSAVKGVWVVAIQSLQDTSPDTLGFMEAVYVRHPGMVYAMGKADTEKEFVLVVALRSADGKGNDVAIMYVARQPGVPLRDGVLPA